jgi:methylthioribose-1-phosphate isomerase
MGKKLTNKRLVARLMDMKHIDLVVINDHAVTARMKQSRVEQHRVSADDFMKIANEVGQPQAVPVTKDNKGQLELWIRFERY